MTHLPECPCPTADDDPWYCCSDCNPGVTPPWERSCICKELHAAEQRGEARAYAERDDWYTPAEFNHQLNIGIMESWKSGVRAARDAVAGIELQFQSFGEVSIDYDDALAALDALLTGESNG